MNNRVRPAAYPGLTAERRRVLSLVMAQTDPVGVLALGTLTGNHPNTLREHLTWLVERGLVERVRRPPSGRGRPAWLYLGRRSFTGPEMSADRAVTMRIMRSVAADEIGAEVRGVGRRWGRRLGHDRGMRPTGDPAATRVATVGVLADLGYRPEPDSRSVRVDLTACPLLALAHGHQDGVCAAHLGMVEGLLEAGGVEAAGTVLTPFSEPGRCRLRLPDRDPGRHGRGGAS